MTPTKFILQWNCNGYFARIEELKLLMSDPSIKCLCLQETRIKQSHKLNVKGYTMYRNDRTTDQLASGGVAILVQENIPSKHIPLNSPLEVIAIELITTIKVTVCNIYIPPAQLINKNEIENVINQLPAPYILLGDFNAHNVLWGSSHTDTREKAIGQILENIKVNLLNNGNPTHLTIATGKFSAIDLAFCHPKIAPLL